MSREDNVESLLTAVLDCGYADLSMILDVDNDLMDEALENIRDNDAHINLNELIYEVLSISISRLQSSVENRINDLESEDESSEEEIAELNAIKELDPSEDFSIFTNYIDSHLSLINNNEVYHQFFEDELSNMEDETSFNIEE